MSPDAGSFNTNNRVDAAVETLGSLCTALQAMECSTESIDAEHYRNTVRRMGAMMAVIAPAQMGSEMRALIASYPAAAELYENQHFERNGLCLHNARRSAAAGRAAQQVIATVRSIAD